MSRLNIVPNVPMGLAVQESQKKRVPRKPQHSFNLKTRPYEISPFLIAPVLAGETMKNAMLQSRVISDTVKSNIIGWWKEYYFFYVPLRSLEGNNTGGTEQGSAVNKTLIESMLLDLNSALGADNTARPHTYSSATGTGKDWVEQCLRTVVANFFRDDGESVDGTYFDFSGAGTSPPIAKIGQKNMWDSLYSKSEIPTMTLDQTPTADIDMLDLDGKYQMWQILRNQKMTEMSFEDYLESFGVRGQRDSTPRPELLRQIKKWTYPTNQVNPAPVLDEEGIEVYPAGAASAALSWSFAETLDKDRFFREPGFIFGVTITRPKVYLSKQLMAGASYMMGALDWMPALMKERVDLSIKNIVGGNGIIAGEFATPDTEDYVFDLRDLLIYGDQFVNWSIDASGNAMPLPVASSDTNSESSYPTSNAVTALFVDPDNEFIKEDGIVHFNILGTQMDHT